MRIKRIPDTENTGLETIPREVVNRSFPFPSLSKQTELYKNLSTRFRLSEFAGTTGQDYMDCYEHFMGANGKEDYLTAANFALQHGFDSVVDIGCACGLQSELFTLTGLRYVGVDVCQNLFWETPGASYLVRRFPCIFPPNTVTSKTLGISRLCAGYLFDDAAKIAEQFDDFLLDCSIPAYQKKMIQSYEQAALLHDPENPERHFGWLWLHGSKSRQQPTL